MPNAALAAVILEQTFRWGTRDLVLCAGARNSPLILPLLDAPERVRIWNHFDERAAAFFALGLAKRDGRPAAVVTTSGTAAAELLPAAIEAHYSGVPLVLITADRPKRFRGSGAPQSILQPGLFGEHVEGSFDCEYPEEFPCDFPWNRSRPIHLNPCFEEPGTEPPAEIDWEGALSEADQPPAELMPLPSFADPTLLDRTVANFEDGVVLLGEIAAADREAVRAFLEKLGAPVWAEATSGLRESPELSRLLIRGGDRAFGGIAPKKVLRIGGVPSLRFWRDLENRSEVGVLSVSSSGFSGLSRESGVVAMPLGELESVAPAAAGPGVKIPDADWLEPLLRQVPRSEPALIRRLSEQIPKGARVFLGNSLPIREWNLAASFDTPHPDVFANRGANGIDGEISAFLGLSEGVEESWGVFGDLTALYDLNAPWTLDQLKSGRRRIVVINNGGGRIFSRLPGLGELEDTKKGTTENRHSLDFSHWAAMWGFDYERANPAGDFEASGERVVIEIRPDDLETEVFWNG